MTLLGVSFGTCRRHCRDILMGRRAHTTETSWWRTTETLLSVPFEICLRRLEDVLMGRCCYVLLRRSHNVPIRCREDVPLRRLGDVPPRHHWVFRLRRTCNVVGTYRQTSLPCCYDVLLLGGSRQYFGSTANLEKNQISTISACVSSKGALILYRADDLSMFFLYSTNGV